MADPRNAIALAATGLILADLTNLLHFLGQLASIRLLSECLSHLIKPALEELENLRIIAQESSLSSRILQT